MKNSKKKKLIRTIEDKGLNKESLIKLNNKLNIKTYIMLLLFILLGSFLGYQLYLDKVLDSSLLSPKNVFFICLDLLLLVIIVFYILRNFALNKENNKLYAKIFRIYDNILYVLTTLGILSFICTFMLIPVTISGTSMNNTLNDGDKVLVYNFYYQPKRNDIVIVDGNDYVNEDIYIVKRVKALPGDEIRFTYSGNDSYTMYVNGNIEAKNVTKAQYEMLNPNNQGISETIIAPGYLILGDNRTPGGSTDSRYFGYVNEEDIYGKAILRIAPFNRFGIIKEYLWGF